MPTAPPTTEAEPTLLDGSPLLMDAVISRWAFTGLLCGAAVLLGVGYLLLSLAPAPSAPMPGLPVEPDPAVEARVRRRRLGAGLVVVIGVGFFAAANFVEPELDLMRYLSVWVVLLLLVVWLLTLAVLDFRQTLRQYRERREELRTRLQLWRKPTDGAAGERTDAERTDAEQRERTP